MVYVELSLFTRTRTKYKSSSICFVLECNAGLTIREIVLSLSHQMVDLRMLIFSSPSSDSSQITSAVVLARLLYSDSVLDLEIVGCFREHHDTGHSPKNMQYHVEDFRSFGSKAWSTSTNLVMLSNAHLEVDA